MSYLDRIFENSDEVVPIPNVLSLTKRLDLSSMAVNSLHTDGGVIKGGTAAARIVSDIANMKFVSIYSDNGATSGDSRLAYLRHYITGAGGGGECLRAFTTVENVVGATAHGMHVSLNFGATGKLSGLGAACRATLHIANQATQSGTLTALQAEIWSDGSTSDPADSKLSALRMVNGGDATGAADVDDDCAAIEFSGFTVANGNMIAADSSPTTCPNITHSVKVRMPDDSLAYMYLGAAPVST